MVIFCWSNDELSGTSMAAPYVSGCIALMKQKYPSLTSQEAKRLIQQHAQSIRNDSAFQQGAGLIQLYETLTQTLHVDSPTLFIQPNTSEYSIRVYLSNRRPIHQLTIHHVPYATLDLGNDTVSSVQLPSTLFFSQSSQRFNGTTVIIRASPPNQQDSAWLFSGSMVFKYQKQSVKVTYYGLSGNLKHVTIIKQPTLSIHRQMFPFESHDAFNLIRGTVLTMTIPLIIPVEQLKLELISGDGRSLGMLMERSRLGKMNVTWTWDGRIPPGSYRFQLHLLVFTIEKRVSSRVIKVM
jgi:hypothetical protein